jgi:hypothetical protein
MSTQAGRMLCCLAWWLLVQVSCSAEHICVFACCVCCGCGGGCLGSLLHWMRGWATRRRGPLWGTRWTLQRQKQRASLWLKVRGGARGAGPVEEMVMLWWTGMRRQAGAMAMFAVMHALRILAHAVEHTWYMHCHAHVCVFIHVLLCASVSPYMMQAWAGPTRSSRRRQCGKPCCCCCRSCRHAIEPHCA